VRCPRKSPCCWHIGGTLDRVPLDQMTDAEQALRKAVADIPAEVCKRLETADKLSDEDRNTIIEIARKSLAPFQPKPEAEAKPEAKTDITPTPESEAKPKPRRTSSLRLNPRQAGSSSGGQAKPESKEKS